MSEKIASHSITIAREIQKVHTLLSSYFMPRVYTAPKTQTLHQQQIQKTFVTKMPVKVAIFQEQNYSTSPSKIEVFAQCLCAQHNTILVNKANVM
jgi:hypothetical protein